MFKKQLILIRQLQVSPFVMIKKRESNGRQKVKHAEFPALTFLFHLKKKTLLLRLHKKLKESSMYYYINFFGW